MGNGRKCDQVAWFTASSLADDYKANMAMDRASLKWAGGRVDSVIPLLRGGDIEAVPAAGKYADMINDAVELAGARDEWSLDVAGAFPCVPACLGGDPACMWSRSPVLDDRGEIAVCVNTAVSSNVSTRDMKRRGVCVLAAILALQRVRNVRAVVYASLDACCPAVRLSVPLDVSEVCAFVTCPQVTRRALYTSVLSYGYSGRWADWAAPVAGDDSERSAVRRLLKIDGDAVIITPDRLGALAAISDSEFVDRINRLLHAVLAGDSDLTL